MNSSLNARTVSYWITTGLVAFGFAAGGLADLTHSPAIVESMTRLGYPPYLATLLGLWKILGAAAVLAPGTARLKEFAYAGILFDLSGAVFSHLAAGDAPSQIVAPLVLLGIAAASYVLRPATRTLGAPLVATSDGARALGKPVAVG